MHLVNALRRSSVTEDRLMVVEAVMAGQLSDEHLTQAEVDEFMILVADAAFEKEMDAAVERGLSVFEGIEGDTIQ